ncbi:MAG: PBP1A family penicillin-binding protein [Candidatus Eisenbacteria bacterium]
MRLFILFLLLTPLAGAAVIYGLFSAWGDELPSPQSLRELEPSMNTVILDQNGEVIDEFFLENRSPRPITEIPELMQEAVLSTEDTRFDDHWGLDVLGIIRAAFTNVTHGTIEEGASTITQQLARKLFLTDSQTWDRKLKEAVLAIRLERSFSKDEILELYLNKIYFGEGAYGVEAAAQTYFGKSVDDLELQETALLAGILANPSAFHPIRRPENARKRRNLVLRRMLQAGVVDSTQYAVAETTAVVLNPRGKSASKAPYFTEAVRRELADRYGDTHVYTGGLTVHTTLDLSMQNAAVEAMEKQLQSIEKQQAHRYKYLKDEATCAGTLAHPENGTPYLQGALVAVEPQTGAIRAMVGGRNFAESKFNRATQAVRQPGSAFKPISFTVSIQDGHSTNDIIYDTPLEFEIPGPGRQVQSWEPKNFDLEFRGPVTLRYSLMKSLNIPAVRLMEEATPRRVIAMAKSMGIDRNLPPYLSLALGTGEVTPLELTSAYGIFANQGIYCEPYMIERVEDRYGSLVDLRVPKTREVIDERTNAIMVSLMQSVMDAGTGASARSSFGFRAPAGGKTGTTDDYSDAWFVGFVPRLACGVWVGFDEKKTIGSRMTGTAAALPSWAGFMKAATADFGDEEFPVPKGLVQLTTCRDTGLIALPDCPKVRDLFLPGRQPNRTCPIHAQYLAPVFGGDERRSTWVRRDDEPNGTP